MIDDKKNITISKEELENIFKEDTEDFFEFLRKIDNAENNWEIKPNWEVDEKQKMKIKALQKTIKDIFKIFQIEEIQKLKLTIGDILENIDQRKILEKEYPNTEKKEPNN